MDTYLGIDLAWSDRNDSGVAALREGDEGLEVVGLGLARGIDAVLAWIDGQLETSHAAHGRVIVMVDAPLIVANEHGGRPCERLVAKSFGSAHAAPYPANRRLLGGYRGDGRLAGEALGQALAHRGFEWPPRALRATFGERARIVHECYPHPAHVRLFELTRTFRYKKKRGRSWDDVRGEFTRYVSALRVLCEPQLHWTRELDERFAVSTLKGVAYKRAEDQLDALCCAYIAALMPRHGRLEAFGDPSSGLIVVPAPPSPA